MLKSYESRAQRSDSILKATCSASCERCHSKLWNHTFLFNMGLVHNIAELDCKATCSASCERFHSKLWTQTFFSTWDSSTILQSFIVKQHALLVANDAIQNYGLKRSYSTWDSSTILQSLIVNGATQILRHYFIAWINLFQNSSVVNTSHSVKATSRYYSLDPNFEILTTSPDVFTNTSSS
jgi:hypothetical protein